jgi:hypothetical protein
MNTPDRSESDERVLTVIPDANVLIHGKALPDLFWTELGRPKIEVLFVPPVIRELDKLKNHSGRPNKIARQLSSDVRALLSAPDRRAEIRQSAPAVTKRVELRTITRAMHDALKLDHADQGLINYALHLRADGQDVLLLTDDTICGTTAQEFGLPTLLLPDHWLRDPEPDEGSKENAKLKAEISRLTAAEPKVLLSFRDDAGEPLARLEAAITRWPALSEAEIDAFMSDVEQRCPPATSFERPASGATDQLLGSARGLTGMLTAFQERLFYEPATEEAIERYKKSDYPNWLDSIRAALGSLHEKLKAQTEWPTALAIASNTGTRPATDVLLSIRARGAFAIIDASAERDQDDDVEDADQEPQVPKYFALPLPPAPPRGRMRAVSLYPGFSDHVLGTAHQLPIASFTPPSPRRSDAFYWRRGQRDWVYLIELECASWRHSQAELVFLLKVRPDEPSDVAGAIELSVHANNISDPPLTQLPIRITFVDGSTIEEARALVEQLSRAARAHGRL